MLKPPRPAGGFSLVELMVAVALIGILLALGVPAVANWSADARLRSVAESLTNGVRLAQATAVGRGRVAVLALTNADPAYDATPAADSSNWFVVVDPLGSETLSAASLIQKSTEARQHGVSVRGPAMVCFNSFGQQTANLTTALSSTVSCATPGTNDAASVAPTTYYELTRPNAKRKFRVLVYAGGRVRMCDALKTLSTTTPDGCP